MSFTKQAPFSKEMAYFDFFSILFKIHEMSEREKQDFMFINPIRIAQQDEHQAQEGSNQFVELEKEKTSLFPQGRLSLKERLKAKRQAEIASTPTAPPSIASDIASFNTLLRVAEEQIDYEAELPEEFRSTPAETYQPGELPPGLVRAGFIDLSSAVEPDLYAQILADPRTNIYCVEIGGIIYIKDSDVAVVQAILTGAAIPKSRVVFSSADKRAMLQSSKEKNTGNQRVSPEPEYQGHILAEELLTKTEIAILRTNIQYADLFIKDNGRPMMRPKDAREFRRLQEAMKTAKGEKAPTSRPNPRNWQLSQDLIEQGYAYYTKLLTRTEQQALQTGHRYTHLYTRYQGRIIMRPQDVEEFRRIRKIPMYAGKKLANRRFVLPPELRTKGYAPAETQLARREIQALRRSERYAHLFIEVKGVVLIRKTDVEEFRRLRLTPPPHMVQVSAERRQQGYYHSSEILTPAEQRALRRSITYAHLYIKENGDRLMRLEDVEEFRKLRSRMITRQSKVK